VVRLRGAPVALSQKEFALVRTLASEPTRVFTKDELLRSIWGFRTLGSTRTLDSHACRLRHKLGRFGDRFVVNVWGQRNARRVIRGARALRDVVRLQSRSRDSPTRSHAGRSRAAAIASLRQCGTSGSPLPPLVRSGSLTWWVRPEAVDHQVDLPIGQTVPVARSRQRPRQQRCGNDQVLGRQVGSELSGGLSAFDERPQYRANLDLKLARRRGEDGRTAVEGKHEALPVSQRRQEEHPNGFHSGAWMAAGRTGVRHRQAE
jgi:hypothetical protein